MKIEKYLAAYKMGVGKSLEYRFDFFFGLLSVVFPIIIQTYLWTAIFSGGDAYYGYTYGQIMMYTFSAGIISQFLETGVESRINGDIHTGQLGNYLVHPIAYAPYRLLSVMGEKMFSAAILTLLLTGMGIAFPMLFDVSFGLANAAGFIPSLLLGFCLSFLLFYCIGLMGLWFIEIGHLYSAIRIVLIVFTGGVFPLEVFGEGALAVMRFLPFMYITYFPTKVLNGTVVGFDVVFGMMVQLMWIGVFAAAAFVMWRAGVKQYAPVGG